jgi:iron-sulfur cluster assembly accessory protein
MKDFLISKNAADKINSLKDLSNNDEYLRIKVDGGGCNGFKYEIVFTDKKTDEDITFNKNGAIVLIDKVSIGFLKNSELDYVEELGNSSFTIKNPNSKSSCGCGTSFSY